MAEKESKLRYNIVGRRKLTVERVPGENTHILGGPRSGGAVAQPPLDMEQVDIEWTHEDGFPPDTIQHVIRTADAKVLMDAVLEKAIEDGVINQGTADAIQTIVPEVMPLHDGMPHVGLVTVKVGDREVIKDQINVIEGTSSQGLNQILEEKRKALAKALDVEL